ncbi:hypothetical protein [Mucilaginibacter sp.]|uniref:hypothetical protein n=1 Tax=Mucilaginibacter sp. TaxID=1882438 RepID=UPI00261C9523|nr:hypothetical protein [Mucilaginibacter sp.]MDB4924074.1 hypothetical protein [Mucilaginibacter sp.]
MIRIIFIAIISLGFTNIAGAQKKHFGSGRKILMFDGKTPKKFYFPVDESKRNSGITSFENLWYSLKLEAMNEPVIYKHKSGVNSYRFTWLRSFHHPIAIRINKNNNVYSIYWKMSDNGKYEKLVTDKHKIISKATWDLFESKLKQLDYWKMGTNSNERSGMDGAQWILEGKKANTYHLIVRWSPESKSKYYQCCDYLIGLTDLKIPAREKY